jgi:parallel beta-helix repeat protein
VLLAPEVLSGGTVSENNVIEENTVVRYNEAIFFLGGPRDVFRNHVIRHNEVIDARIYNVFLIDNGTIAFLGGGLYQGNVIKDNVLRGSEGVGLVLATGNGNQIIGNEFHDLPGLKDTYSGDPGTAIILGAATTRNRVIRNEFENVVNTIVDLGTDNIIQNGGKASVAAPPSLRSSTVGAGVPKLQHPKARFLRSFVRH